MHYYSRKEIYKNATKTGSLPNEYSKLYEMNYNLPLVNRLSLSKEREERIRQQFKSQFSGVYKAEISNTVSNGSMEVYRLRLNEKIIYERADEANQYFFRFANGYVSVDFTNYIRFNPGDIVLAVCFYGEQGLLLFTNE